MVQQGTAGLILVLAVFVGAVLGVPSQPTNEPVNIEQFPIQPESPVYFSPEPSPTQTLKILTPVQSEQAMSTPTKKAVFIDSGTGLTAAQITAGSRFDLFMVNKWGNYTGLTTVKSAHPDIKIIGYRDLIAAQATDTDWSTIDANEAWFLHTAGGARIQHTGYGWWLMDPASAGWRAHWVGQINSVLGNLSGAYDGIFCDDTFNEISAIQSSLSGTVQAANVASWHADVLAFLTYITANITSGKIALINTNEWSTYTHVAAVTGEVLEGFIHEDWYLPSATSRDLSLILAQINNLAANSASKTVWCMAGTLPGTTAENARVLKYCFAGYLLGMNGSGAHFSFNKMGSADGANGYYSLMDTNIGSPTAAYALSGGLYRRTYSGGLVLFNPSGSSIAVSLTAGDYTFLDGSPVTNFSVDAYSGEILLVAPEPPIEPPPAQYFSVTVTAGTGGSTNPSGVQSILNGSSFTATATAGTGYNFTRWDKDGVSYSTENTITINITALTTLDAVFTASATPEPPPPQPGTVPVGYTGQIDSVVANLLDKLEDQDIFTVEELLIKLEGVDV